MSTHQDAQHVNVGTTKAFGIESKVDEDESRAYASALPASIEPAWQGIKPPIVEDTGQDGVRWAIKSSGPLSQSHSHAASLSEVRNPGCEHRPVDDRTLGQNISKAQLPYGEDCTFKPKIRPLPSHYGALKDDAMPIDQRFQKWSLEKELNAKARRDDAVTMQLDGCTFKPKINTSSKRAMDISRGGDERPVPERLYTDGKVAREELEEYKESLREQAEEEFKRQCTFTPKTNTARFKAVPKYNEPRCASAPPRQLAETSNAEQSNFAPKTNDLTPKMSAARLYCQENVFDRLSRNVTQNEDERSTASAEREISVRANVMDMAEFMSALQGGTGRDGTARHRGTFDAGGARDVKQLRPSSANSRRSFDTDSSARIDTGPSTPRGTSLPDSAKVANGNKFQEFLHRQQTSEMKRSKNRNRLQKQTTPTFQPKICPKSKDMHTRNGRAPFLERVESEAARRERTKVRNEAKANNQPECTFRPALTAKAQKVKPRSVVEMTRDSQKIETKRVRQTYF